jgi:hypothetical protein
MGTHDSAVDQQMFHIGISDEMHVHPFPNTFIAPACEALVYTVPFAISCWQQSPLGTASHDPQHTFHKTSTL